MQLKDLGIIIRETSRFTWSFVDTSGWYPQEMFTVQAIAAY